MFSAVLHGVRHAPALGMSLVAFDYAGRELCDWFCSTTSDNGISATTLSLDHAFEQLDQTQDAVRSWKLDGCMGGEDALVDCVRSRVGYTVRCRTSSVKHAGDGVFAAGTIPKGCIVSAYSGYWRSAWDTLFYFPHVFGRTSDFLIYQSDSSSIDGSMQTSQAQRQSTGYVSPLSCAQLVNHPPAGISANVAFMSLEVPNDFNIDQIDLRMTKGWPWANSNISNRRRSVITVLVSLRNIEDTEELFADYEYLDCGENLPEWYTPCRRETLSV